MLLQTDNMYILYLMLLLLLLFMDLVFSIILYMSLPFSSRLIVTCTESQESHCVAPTSISWNYWFVGHCAPVEVGSYLVGILSHYLPVAFLRPFRWYLSDFCTQNHTPPTKGWVEKTLPDRRCCCHVACPRNGGKKMKILVVLFCSESSEMEGVSKYCKYTLENPQKVLLYS